MAVGEKEITKTEVKLDSLTDTGKHLVKALLDRIDEVKAQNDELLRRERERDEREKTRPDLGRLLVEAMSTLVGKYNALRGDKK